jgi:PAS domain S-box-containing protein
VTTGEAIRSIGILLIEDNPGDARLIQEMLAEPGKADYHLENADRLSQGLERFLEGGIDVVLLDLSLPDSQGLETLSKVRAQASEVPIIVLTGLDDEVTAVEAVRQGAQDYLVKGDVDSKLLWRAVRYSVERKRSEEALRKSEEKLRQLFRSATDGIFTLDLNGAYTELNERMLEMLGVSSKDEILGKNYFEFFNACDINTAIVEMQRTLEQGTVMHLEYISLRGDFSEFDAELTGALLRDASDNPVGFVGILRDITERKKIETMKSDFVSLVSHQLKTPVVGIKLGIENMLGGLTGELTDKQKRYLQEMYEICSRSHRLVADLLNVSRIERGVLSVDIEPVKLREIVDLALRDYQKDIKKKGLALKLEEVDEGIVVLADVDKMVEALSNVINNAVKFTGKGSITIRITDEITMEGKYGIVEVRDTGTGMSDKVLNNLFTKEKVLNGPPIAGGGVGIGLYITKNFMKAQKGDVTATSVVGEGSTFALSVPRDRRGRSREGV